MTVTPEKLAAYADGELSEFEAAQVRRAVEADPALARQLAQLQSLSAMLSDRYDPILQQPVPETLTAPITQAAKVVDLGEVRAARQRWFERPSLRYAAGPAIAAALVLAVFVGRGPSGPGEGYADAQLAAALDRNLSGETSADGTRVLLSFRNDAGEACRAWSGAAKGGIACRDADGWKLRKEGDAAKAQTGEFQQAGSGDAAIMAAAQDMAAGNALDRAQEEAARAAGWKPQN